MESEKRQNQVFTLFPPPWEIAQRPDFHIPTAATAMLPLPCSIPNRNTAHSELPRFQPAPQLKPSNTAAPLYPALPTPNSEEANNPVWDNTGYCMGAKRLLP